MELEDIILISVSTLGFISLFKSILSLVNWVWIMFLRPAKNLKEYGSWVMVTGSTDGIGKALALDLAAKGLNLVLIGRNPTKLEATADEIRQKHGKQVGIKNIVIDFATFSSEEISQAVEEGVKGLDIGILINNAGLAYPYARFFHEVDLDLMDGIVKVNIDSSTWVTRSVLPTMLKKRKGAIVNIGSASSVVLPSYPLYTVYAATKAYLAMFSRSISLEYKQQGIDIQCQIPLFVATKMTKLKRSPLFIPSPEMYSKASIRWIGYEYLCTPFWPHSVQGWIVQALPNAVVERYIFQYFLGMRKRGQLKDAMRTTKQK